MDEFRQLLTTCSDTAVEKRYFNNIVKSLSKVSVPTRLWEQNQELECKYVCDEYACKNGVQVVLGRLFQTEKYIACDKFLVLNIDDWSIEQNDLFVEGISRPYQRMSDKPLCKKFPIRLCHYDYPEHLLECHEKEYRTKIIPGSVTTRELCLLNAKGFTFYQPYYLLSRDDNIDMPKL